jgi:hypothetical protein
MKAGERTRRLVIIVAAVGVIALASAMAVAVANDRADGQRADPRSQLEESFATTDLETVRALHASSATGRSPSERDPLGDFLDRPGQQPDFFQVNAHGRETYVAVYSLDYWGFDRCILVTWHADGVTMTEAAEDACPNYPIP